jgi:hypothetical protein
MPLVDVEDEHDGAEPNVCGEPNRGSFDRMDEDACTDELMYRSIVRDLCTMVFQSV